MYVASSLGTAGAEVFGDEREAAICERYRAAAVVPTSPALVQSLVGVHAMSIGAFPFLGSGSVDFEISQAWARAIYEDLPASKDVCGIRYRSAHDEGFVLALWDTAPSLEVVWKSSVGRQDFAVVDQRVFVPFSKAMGVRGVQVRKVAPARCPECMRI